MSNQIPRNIRTRYYPLKKTNSYSFLVDLAIPKDTPVNLQYPNQILNEIGPNFQYIGGIITIKDDKNFPNIEGMYTFNFVVSWSSTNTGLRILYFQKNNNINRPCLTIDEGLSAGNSRVQSGSCTVHLIMGDTIKIIVEQTSNQATLNIEGSSTTVNFSNLEINLIQ